MLKSNLNFINLDNLESVARGDNERIFKYLKQFNDLIPERLIQLKLSVQNKDRIEIRRLVHKMSPQLLFFGLKNISITIQRLEFEHLTLDLIELEKLVNDIILKLEGALKEVQDLINQNIE